MLRRFRPGYLMAAFVIASGCALLLLIFYGPILRPSLAVRERVFVYGMAGFYVWLLVFYRLLIAVCNWGPAPGSPAGAWKPLEAAERQFDSHQAMSTRSPVIFRISPWPWVKLHGYFIVLPILGFNLLLVVLAPSQWQQLPLIEQYMFALVAVFYVALNGAFFLMHYRLLHFSIASRACGYRIAQPGADTRSIVIHFEGSFPLDLIARIWVREKLSQFLRWKQLDYGITFKAGCEMNLGLKTRCASLTGVSDLEWERLIVVLSERTGIAIERHMHGAQSPARNQTSS
jgi:hypothetical protein